MMNAQSGKPTNSSVGGREITSNKNNKGGLRVYFCCKLEKSGSLDTY